jgi:hypothetical protein
VTIGEPGLTLGEPGWTVGEPDWTLGEPGLTLGEPRRHARSRAGLNGADDVERRQVAGSRDAYEVGEETPVGPVLGSQLRLGDTRRDEHSSRSHLSLQIDTFPRIVEVVRSCGRWGGRGARGSLHKKQSAKAIRLAQHPRHLLQRLLPHPPHPHPHCLC